jgi:hypothetical protein
LAERSLIRVRFGQTYLDRRGGKTSPLLVRLPGREKTAGRFSQPEEEAGLQRSWRVGIELQLERTLPVLCVGKIGSRMPKRRSALEEDELAAHDP